MLVVDDVDKSNKININFDSSQLASIKRQYPLSQSDKGFLLRKYRKDFYPSESKQGGFSVIPEKIWFFRKVQIILIKEQIAFQ